MKALTKNKPIDEILNYFEKIRTIELAIESLPDQFIVDWRERLKVKQKKKVLAEEIIQLRGILRRKMNPAIVGGDYEA